nr:translation initiation factor IF-2-like [Pan paniscus]
MRTLVRRHAGGAGLPDDFSLSALGSGFSYSVPPGRQASLGLQTCPGGGRPCDPAVRAQNPRPAPPAGSGGAPGLLAPRLNVSAGTRREDQAQAPGGGMLSTGSPDPASYSFAPKTSGCCTNNLSIVVLENIQEMDGNAFPKEGRKLV